MTSETATSPTAPRLPIDGPIRVLVVEDSLTQAKKLLLAADSAGIRGEVVQNGDAALQLLRPAPPGPAFDAVVSCVTMRGFDGFELCRRIRKDAFLSRLPFVLLATMADPAEVVRGLECGADGFFSKPFDPDEVVARVRSLVRSRRISEAAPDGASFAARFFDETVQVRAGRDQAVDLLLPALEKAIRRCRVLENRNAEHAKEAPRDEAIGTMPPGRNRFLEALGSEIRPPLTGILGMAGTLAQTPLSVAQSEHLSAIKGSAQTLLGVIDNLLDYARIETGPIASQMTDLDAGGIVEDVAGLLAEQANAKGIELACYAGPGLAALTGDAIRLRQVVLNLARNAVKFTSEGEVSLSARLESEGPDGAVIRFEVRDTGIGIAAPVMERLFERLRPIGSGSLVPVGSGLGLAISRHFVQLLGGTMGATSVPGEGSTFWFTASFTRTPGAPAPAPRDTRLYGKSVLVIDDSATSRDALKRLLKDQGMKVVLAEEAGAGLESILSAARAGTSFDLVLLDLTLPGPGAFEVARQALRDLGSSAPPIVLLTPSARRRRSDDSIDSSAISAWLPKPVRRAVLFETIGHVLSGKSEKGAEPRLPGWLSGPEWDRPVPKGRKGVALVAEDNKVNQRVAAMLLDRLGYDAEIFANGLEAVAAAESRPYGLALMDCEMPGMDGFEATREIRKREGIGRHLPILAMTAHSSSTEKERCLAAGMDGFLQKPLSLGTLEEAIGRWWSPPLPGPSGRQTS
jgi:CheY-like chemotaxis protein